MTTKLDPFFDQLRGAWRFRWMALLAALAVAIVGWLIVFGLPDRYEAQAEVMVDTRTVLKPVLEGLATNQDVNVQLNYVRQALLAGPQLTQLAIRSGVMPATGLGPADQQGVLDGLQKRIDLSVERTPDEPGQNLPNAGSTTYDITYQDVDGGRALRLVRMLLDGLINETLGGSQQGSEHAQQFLKAQIASYQTRLQASEDRLAAFKSQHLGVLPTTQGGYFEQLQHESEAIEDVKTKLLVANSQRHELQNELHGDAAVSATAAGVVGPNGVMMGGDTVSQIELVQAHLNQLLLKYTDKYPDVIAARQQLAALKQRRAEEVAALRRGDANAAALSGASSSPIYQSIQLALNRENVEIADLSTELSEHQAKAQELQELLDKTPQLEAQYAQLSRDYDINKKQYAALLASYDKARLGEQAGNAGAVRFEVVQPPAVSYTPVWPNRTKLLTAVLILALGAGGALAYALNQLRPVVGSPGALRQFTGIPVVAVVGCAFPTRTAIVTHRQIRRFSYALAVLIVGFVVVLVLSYLGIRLGGMAGIPTVSA
ncbi:MAG TPA: XrtA system polysaccharide chain length determinant [Steroidobacteraceae bacterium]|nr:XrtA system polysaccharide chain length determinant [Steroidobacteraceae bacterium]